MMGSMEKIKNVHVRFAFGLGIGAFTYVGMCMVAGGRE
jgi:hypothetical protein